MQMSDFSTLDEISSPLALIAKGPEALNRWLEKRNTTRYEEFVRAALDGDVLPESADAMTAEDLLAMLRALDQDIEAEKATLYGRLACAIAKGRVDHDLKRHFIKGLSELSCSQVELLRKALIAERYEVLPGQGSGNLDPNAFLGVGSSNSIDRLTFERWGMLDGQGMSPLGRQFVDVCFTAEELVPEAVGFKVWARGMIHLACNEFESAGCNLFLNRLSEEAHRSGVRVQKSAARQGKSNRPLHSGGIMVVVVTDDPDRLIRDQETVEHALLGRAQKVVAMTNPTAALPSFLKQIDRVDASPEQCANTVEALLRRFEESGFR